MYILLSNTNKYLSDNIKILIDLFDKIIVAIFTYNCEILHGVRPYFQRACLYLTFYHKNNAKTL